MILTINRFISDRNYVDTDGNEQKIEWVANVEYYTQKDGLSVPGYVSAT